MGIINRLCTKGLLLDKGMLIGNGNASEIVQSYERLALQSFSSEGLGPGVLFKKEVANPSQFDVCELTIANINGELIEQLKTMDDFNFDIKFYSPKDLKNGSVAVFINSLNGETLLRFATRPDSNLDLDFRQGINRVRCRVNKIPLSPGTYILSVGLAIPMREWLYLNKELCRLDIGAKDIHLSGFMPFQSHALAVTEYNWEIAE